MVPYKIFTFLDNTTAHNYTSETDFPYKGDLTLVVTGTWSSGYIDVKGILRGQEKRLTLVKLDTTFDVVSLISSAGTYAVVGADGFEKIKVIGPGTITAPVTVVGKFTFAG